MKKSILSVLLSIGLLCAGTSLLFSDISGDVNNDGAVDTVDAILVSQYYVGLNTIDIDQSRADVNKDKIINILDVLEIVNLSQIDWDKILRRQSAPLQTAEPKPVNKSDFVWISHISGYQCQKEIYATLDAAIFFLMGKGISVYGSKTKSTKVPAACGYPSGTSYCIQISKSNLQKAIKLGWKSEILKTIWINIDSGRQCSPEIFPTQISAKNNLEKNNIKVIKIKTDKYIVCQACDICPSGTVYSAKILASDVERAKELGWKTK